MLFWSRLLDLSSFHRTQDWGFLLSYIRGSWYWCILDTKLMLVSISFVCRKCWFFVSLKLSLCELEPIFEKVSLSIGHNSTSLFLSLKVSILPPSIVLSNTLHWRMFFSLYFQCIMVLWQVLQIAMCYCSSVCLLWLLLTFKCSKEGWVAIVNIL